MDPTVPTKLRSDCSFAFAMWAPSTSRRTTRSGALIGAAFAACVTFPVECAGDRRTRRWRICRPEHVRINQVLLEAFRPPLGGGDGSRVRAERSGGGGTPSVHSMA
jgi:hypothetical protein